VQADNYWSLEAEIDIGGYSSKTFDSDEQVKFKQSLGAALGISASAVEIKAAKDSSTQTVKQLGVAKSVTVEFSIIVHSEELSNQVEQRLTTDSFYTEFPKQMKKFGLDPSRVKENRVGQVVQVAAKAAEGVVVAGAIGGALFLGVGAYKLKQLTGDNSVNGENSRLTGNPVMDKL
jgi:hypothetical protein